jgi:hypothetical protein
MRDRTGRKKPWEALRSGLNGKAPQSSTPRPERTSKGRQGWPRIVHTSLYLPEPLYEGLREAAFRERCKIHDIVLEGIRLALGKRGRKQ